MLTSARSALVLFSLLVLCHGCTKTVYVYTSDVTKVGQTTSHPTPTLAIGNFSPSPLAPSLYSGRWILEEGPSPSAWPADLSSLKLIITRPDDGIADGIAHTTWVHSTSLARESDANTTTWTFTRDAGSLSLSLSTPTPTGARESGDATLRLDPAYAQTLATLTSTEITSRDHFDLFLHNLPLAYAQSLHDVGYRFKLDELRSLHRSGVSSTFAVSIHKAGYDFTAAQLLNLSRNGISSNFASALKDGGWSLDDSELISLSRSGVSSNYAKAMRAAGFDKPQDVIELSRNGVTTNFALSLKDAGHPPSPDAAALVKMSRSGVSTQYIKTLTAAGYQFSFDDLVNLSRNGVSSAYAASARKAGYTFSADDLIKLSRSGVSSTFLASLHDPTKPNLPADAIIDLSRQGMNPATIKRLRGL